MRPEAPAAVLRAGLLATRRIVVAGVDVPPPDGDAALGTAVAARCAALGAQVRPLAVDPLAEESVVEAAAAALPRELDALVWDGAIAFEAGGGASVDAVRAAVDGGWPVVRAVARHAMLDRGGGKVALLAPRPGGADAAAARAALENLARTLSIEWSRFGVRTVAILPGATTAPAEVAELVAYVASDAGDYFSGCAFTLA